MRQLGVGIGASWVLGGVAAFGALGFAAGGAGAQGFELTGKLDGVEIPTWRGMSDDGQVLVGTCSTSPPTRQGASGSTSAPTVGPGTLPGQAGLGEPDGVVNLDDLGFFLNLWLTGTP